jgi:hypothetical protein
MRIMHICTRANRVFPGKHSGVIVDYANVFASLEKALAIYGAGKGGVSPVKDKAQLVAALREAVEAATAFCGSHGVDLVALEALPLGSLERLEAVENAINALIAPESLRRDLFAQPEMEIGATAEPIGEVVLGKPAPRVAEWRGHVQRRSKKTRTACGEPCDDQQNRYSSECPHPRCPVA